MTLRSSSLVVALSAVLLCGGTIDPRASDSKHIEFGKKFPFVARLLCRTRDGSREHDGSCVLVGSKWAVTAAHVVDGMDEWVVVTDDGKRHEVSGVSVHQDYKSGLFSKGDIAVCRSKDDFGLKWYPPLYDRDDEKGRVATIAGYGMSGTLSSGRSNQSDGIRRAGSNVVDEVEEGYVVCSTGRGVATSLEFLITPGDSGGGLFIQNSLAGINSHVSARGREPPRGVYGEESGHTRVSEYREWIEKEMSCHE